jgi:hypothetical protein
MFFYQPPKGNRFGHALRPSDPRKAWPALRGFLDSFFEPAQPESIELEVIPDFWSGSKDHVEECRKSACAAFGGPIGRRSWRFAADKHQQAVDFVISGYPWPGGSTSPLSLSFNYTLRWKAGVLPKEVWLEPYSDAPNGILRISSLIVYLQNRCFASTMFLIPVPVDDPGAFEFLGAFSRTAPFKMKPRHFRLADPAWRRGTFRKPDQVMTARLEEALNEKL